MSEQNEQQNEQPTLGTSPPAPNDSRFVQAGAFLLGERTALAARLNHLI